MTTPQSPLHQPTFYFIGVTTGQSAAQRIFPRWMAALGRPEVALQGVDFRIHDESARYRALVEAIKADPLALGGLITTHKIDLLAASRDLFTRLDPYAQICDEISCISKRGDELVGHAIDPVADGRALDGILGAGYFGRTGGELVSLGAGGAAAALALHIINKSDPADWPMCRRWLPNCPPRLISVSSTIVIQPRTMHCWPVCRRPVLSSTPPAWVKTAPALPSPTPLSFRC